jgi:hypothetical protein
MSIPDSGYMGLMSEGGENYPWTYTMIKKDGEQKYSILASPNFNDGTIHGFCRKERGAHWNTMEIEWFSTIGSLLDAFSDIAHENQPKTDLYRRIREEYT